MPEPTPGNEPSLWQESFQQYDLTLLIEIAITVVVGVVVIGLVLRSLRLIVSRGDFSPLVIHPVINALRWVGYMVIAAMVLGKFGHNMFTILSTVLAMIAISFVAVWSMLSHITGTFLLLITKPFKVNDVIEFAGETVKGRVVDLNLFYTTLRTPDGDFFQIPNNMFFQKTIRRTPAASSQQIELESQLPQERPVE